MLKGPPFPENPILFAGICAAYSNKAILQLNKITPAKLRPENQVYCLNFKCPYQAMVMNTFDTIKSAMVTIPFIINFFQQSVFLQNGSFFCKTTPC
jgi:hypothetical protein